MLSDVDPMDVELSPERPYYGSALPIAGAAGGDPDRPVRVLVVDEHAAVRTSIIQALTDVPDLEVSREAVDADGACQAVTSLMPDVVLIDISDREHRGLDATRAIHRTNPGTRVVAVTEFA